MACLLALSAGSARAGIFDDEDARKAILDLRTRIQTTDDNSRSRQAELVTANAALLEQITQLRRSLLDLNSQLEAPRADAAKLRGGQEQLARDVAQSARDVAQLARDVAQLARDVAQSAQQARDLAQQARDVAQLPRDLAELQRSVKDVAKGLDDRLRALEPQKVTVEGRELMVEPDEKRSHDQAMAALRAGDFDKAATALAAFLQRYPTTGYADSARFWLGNALYGQKNYKEAVAVFRGLVTGAPNHARAPEALLAIANCQIEMKDNRSARKTIDELIKFFPTSEAAVAGKERLGSLKG